MPSQPISEFQFQKLLGEVNNHPNKEIASRDVLFYEMLYYLGLRPMECRCIEVSQIDFQEKSIFIPANHNKESQEDDVFVPDFLFQKILAYLKNRKTKSKFLFPCLLHHTEKKDIVVNCRCKQRDFTAIMQQLGFLHVSYIDKQGIPRYNLNLYSFRKRFGTESYKKFHDPKITANLLRHYDPQLKSVWRYVFTAQKEDRKSLMKELYA